MSNTGRNPGLGREIALKAARRQREVQQQARQRQKEQDRRVRAQLKKSK